MFGEESSAAVGSKCRQQINRSIHLGGFLNQISDDISNVFLAQRFEAIRHERNPKRRLVSDIGDLNLRFPLHRAKFKRLLIFRHDDPIIILLLLRRDVVGHVIRIHHPVRIENIGKQHQSAVYPDAV